MLPELSVVELAVEPLVRDQLLDLELAEGAPDLLEPVQLALGPVAELAHLALAALLDLAADVALGTLRLELGEVGLQLLGAGLQVLSLLALREAAQAIADFADDHDAR